MDPMGKMRIHPAIFFHMDSPILPVGNLNLEFQSESSGDSIGCVCIFVGVYISTVGPQQPMEK